MVNSCNSYITKVFLAEKQELLVLKIHLRHFEIHFYLVLPFGVSLLYIKTCCNFSSI